MVNYLFTTSRRPGPEKKADPPRAMQAVLYCVLARFRIFFPNVDAANKAETVQYGRLNRLQFERVTIMTHRKPLLKIAALVICLVLCGACHSGGGSGSPQDASAVDAADPYAGTWIGHWDYSTGNAEMSLEIKLISLGHNQYSGTATTVKDGKTQHGPVTAIFTNVVKPVMSFTIKWEGAYEETVLEGDVTQGAAKTIISGSVDHFVGPNLYTGTFSISKND